MLKTARNIVFAGALPLLLAAPAFAQYGYQGRYDRIVDNGYANRVVEGTVASAVQTQYGERIRLTSGMDLVVPNSVIATNQGRRYQTSLLRPGDLVRMEVFSRPGDGRDARVRSFELIRSGGDYYNNRYSNGYVNGRNLTGTVVSFDRRDNMMVLQTDSGRTINVDVSNYSGRFHRGDRVSVSGRMDRDRGSFIALGVNRY
jgi:hypothetical protein